MSRQRHGLVIAGIASIPSREQSLRIALASVADQVDQVEVVLNGYAEIPEWLCSPRITVTTSKEVGDHADNAKFLGMRKYEECVYFGIDDDIQYPPDYVARMLSCMERYGGRVAVGVHGAFVPERPGTFLGRRVFCFWDGLAFDAPCSYVGTGTIALGREAMPSSPLSLFTDVGMSDLFVAAHLKLQQIPVISLQRSANWLRKIPNPGHPSLWQRAQLHSVRQDAVLRLAGPWGTADLIRRCRGPVLEAFSTEVRVALEAADRIASGQMMPDGLRDDLVRMGSTIRGILHHYAGPHVALSLTMEVP